MESYFYVRTRGKDLTPAVAYKKRGDKSDARRQHRISRRALRAVSPAAERAGNQSEVLSTYSKSGRSTVSLGAELGWLEDICSTSLRYLKKPKHSSCAINSANQNEVINLREPHTTEINQLVSPEQYLQLQNKTHFHTEHAQPLTSFPDPKVASSSPNFRIQVFA